MSIDLEVGIFVDCADDEDDPYGFYACYEQEFNAINAFLRLIGLPEHYEPLSLADGESKFHRSAKTEMRAFKNIVWDIESKTSLRLPHLAELSIEDAIYLPILFEEVLEFPDRPLGSSYKLFAECRLLAKLLSIYDDIEYAANDMKRDPVVLLIENMLDLAKKEKNIPFLPLKSQMLNWYPQLAENPWSVTGTGGCMNLYEAAKFSIKHKAAVVIY